MLVIIIEIAIFSYCENFRNRYYVKQIRECGNNGVIETEFPERAAESSQKRITIIIVNIAANMENHYKQGHWLFPQYYVAHKAYLIQVFEA